MGKYNIGAFLIALIVLTSMFFILPSYKPAGDYKHLLEKGGTLRFESPRFTGTFINQGADFVLKLDIAIIINDTVRNDNDKHYILTGFENKVIFEKMPYKVKDMKVNTSLTLYNEHQSYILHFAKGKLGGVTQIINHNPDLGMQGGTIYYEQQWN